MINSPSLLSPTASIFFINASNTCLLRAWDGTSRDLERLHRSMTRRGRKLPLVPYAAAGETSRAMRFALLISATRKSKAL